MRRLARLGLALVVTLGGCGGGDDDGGTPPPVTEGEPFGQTYAGDYHLGPVDFAETAWHNACAPYPAAIQALTGPYLAGVDGSLGGDGSLCDACALVTTRLGRTIMVRIVTYGVSGAPGDMDLSPEAYDAIYQEDPQGTPADPRPMTWQLAKCPDSGQIFLQYQTEANPYWTSLWVRNGNLPIDRLEVRATAAAPWSALVRAGDGTFTKSDGFGMAGFELQITGRDGTAVHQSFTGFEPGALVETTLQF